MDCLRKIGKYEVLSSILGDGGFCCVYPCQYESDTSGKSVAVAVKISLVPVEDTTYDMKVGSALRIIRYSSAEHDCIVPA